MTRSLRGLDAGTALGLLLRSAGGAPASKDRATTSAADLLRDLFALGFVARVVRCDHPEALTAGTPRPSLVELQDGSWLHVCGRFGSMVTVDTLDGRVELEAAALVARLSGTMIELTPRVPLPGSLWIAARVAFRGSPVLKTAILVTTVVYQVASLIPPLLTRFALDRVLPSRAVSLLPALAIMAVSAALFRVWLGWIRQRALLSLRTRAQLVLERGFFKHVLGLSFEELQGHSRGELMQAMYGLAELRGFAAERVPGLWLDGASAVFYAIAMWSLLPAEAAVVSFGLLVVAAGVVIATHHEAACHSEVVRAQVRQRAFTLECILGLPAIRAAAAESAVLSRWASLLLTQMAATRRRQAIGLMISVFLETARQAVLAAALVWLARQVLLGRASVGTLTAFLQFGTALAGSVLGATGGWGTLLNLRPQLTRTRLLAATPPETPPVSPAVIRRQGPLTMRGVHFRYPGGPWILVDSTMVIRAGETHRIVGPSGCGKTTVLRLFAGLCKPTRGTVTVLGDLAPSQAREAISYLPQQCHLYSGSIYENLHVLSGFASRVRILAAAEASGLDGFVSSLPMSYNTIVSPGGINFSGGQRQLVAITAVMASDRPVVLLDEAFANLDSVSRSRVWADPWFDDRTVVYVSHDEDPATARVGAGSSFPRLTTHIPARASC